GGALATAGDGEAAVRLWDVAAAAEVRAFSLFREAPACLAFVPDGRTLAAGWPWSIQLWDTATGDKRLILEGHRHFSASLALAPDRAIVAAAVRGDLLLWPVAADAPPADAPARRLLSFLRRAAPATSPRPAARTLAGAAERLDAVAVTPDGRRVLAGGAAGT